MCICKLYFDTGGHSSTGVVPVGRRSTCLIETISEVHTDYVGKYIDEKNNKY